MSCAARQAIWLLESLSLISCAPADSAHLARFNSSSCAGSATSITRWTKMPGVTTISGSMAPAGTTCRACTTASAEAMHISGLKFRAAARDRSGCHGVSAVSALTRATSAFSQRSCT